MGDSALLALLVHAGAALQATVRLEAAAHALITITGPLLRLALGLLILLRHDHAFCRCLFDWLDVHGLRDLPAADLVQGYRTLIVSLLVVLLVADRDLDRQLLRERIGGPAPFSVVVEVRRVGVGLLLIQLFAPLSRRQTTLLLALLVQIGCVLGRERCWIVGEGAGRVRVLMLRVLLQLRLVQVYPLVRPLDPSRTFTMRIVPLVLVSPICRRLLAFALLRVLPRQLQLHLLPPRAVAMDPIVLWRDVVRACHALLLLWRLHLIVKRS